MKRKMRVWFKIKPKLKISTKETYPNQKITPEYKDDELIGLHVDIEVDFSETNETVKRKSKKVIIPLMERLRYLRGVYLKEELVRIKQIDPPEATGYGFGQLTGTLVTGKRYPMPKEQDLVTDDNTISQLTNYNRGKSAKDVAERIKNFYLVIESEVEINKSYILNKDMKFTRHAVSHNKITRYKECREFLESKIGTNSIDYNNSDHIKFLKEMEQKIQQEAKSIVDQKVNPSK